MFLTTNRIQSIDPAFKSRIYSPIAYPALSATARSKLWETFILKGTEQNRPRWLTSRFLEKISKQEVNGREINNIVRVAHALALNQEQPMKAEDLSQGLQSRSDFQRDFDQATSKRRLEDEDNLSSNKKIRGNDHGRSSAAENQTIDLRQHTKSW